jgi:hypothetical protein
VAAHLRKVQEQLDVHIGLVGHTGKDEKKGPRGSNARLGDDDVMIQIAIDGNVRVARVTKANDQPERDLVTFQLKPFEFGKDEDGDPIDVAVIEAVADQAKTKKPVKLSNGERAALRELTECVADHAEPPTDRSTLPARIEGRPPRHMAGAPAQKVRDRKDRK